MKIDMEIDEPLKSNEFRIYEDIVRNITASSFVTSNGITIKQNAIKNISNYNILQYCKIVYYKYRGQNGNISNYILNVDLPSKDNSFKKFLKHLFKNPMDNEKGNFLEKKTAEFIEKNFKNIWKLSNKPNNWEKIQTFNAETPEIRRLLLNLYLFLKKNQINYEDHHHTFRDIILNELFANKIMSKNKLKSIPTMFIDDIVKDYITGHYKNYNEEDEDTKSKNDNKDNDMKMIKDNIIRKLISLSIKDIFDDIILGFQHNYVKYMKKKNNPIKDFIWDYISFTSSLEYNEKQKFKRLYTVLETIIRDIYGLDDEEANSYIEYQNWCSDDIDTLDKLGLIKKIKTKTGKCLVTLPRIYEQENTIINFFKNYLDKPIENETTINTDGMKYLQKKFIDNYPVSSFNILVGGPGTGKSHVISSIITTTRDSSLILTPTGMAKGVIEDKLNYKDPDNFEYQRTMTIHRSFKTKKPTKFGGACNACNNSVQDCDYHFFENVTHLFFEESGMVNINTLYNFIYNHFIKLNTFKNLKSITLIGDTNQLPPIGFGNPLYSLIEIFKNKTNYVELTEVCRQEDALIPNICKQIINRDPSFLDIKDKNFKWITDKNVAFEEIVNKDYIKKHGVIANTNKLCEKINKYIQDKKYPGNEDSKYLILKRDEPIVITKNDYDTNIFNGNIGKVTSVKLVKGGNETNRIEITIEIVSDIEKKQSTYILDICDKDHTKINNNDTKINSDYYQVIFDDKNIDSKFVKKCDEFMIGPCVTVHKFQGNERDSIYIFIGPAKKMAQNLLYTAISRGKKNILLYGDYDHINKIIQRKHKFSNSLMNFIISDQIVNIPNSIEHYNHSGTLMIDVLKNISISEGVTNELDKKYKYKEGDPEHYAEMHNKTYNDIKENKKSLENILEEIVTSDSVMNKSLHDLRYFLNWRYVKQ